MSPTVSRSPTRPASPTSRPHDAVLSAALAAALQHLPPLLPPDMHEVHDTLPLRGDKEKLHSTLDIVVNSEQLILRGTGNEVEPVLLSGHVVLQLCEPTSIKEITLHFRGKAKIPPSGSDSLNMSNSGFSYLVCDHDWSFLEGEKKHSHTLKAGRHLFPFHLQVGGTLPSSIATAVLGGASVQYKLRAVASRPGLAHNFQAVMPITITRTFSSEALEYQQSLEIENTWPGKLMYSLMIPHKAWAAGDKLTALAKFSPIAKGAKVLNVTTTINESVKLYARTGHQETSRIIATAKHAVIGGRAVCTDEYQYRHRIPLLHYHHHTIPPTAGRNSQSAPGTPLGHHSSGTHSPNSSCFPSVPSTPVTENSAFILPENSSASGVGSLTSVDENQVASAEETDSNEDVVTTIQITIPKLTTPSHGVEPLVITHRVRWNILIANLDGHTSELRCSLPLHVLHHSMLDEAIASTMLTRRLLLGEHDGPTEQEEEDVQLPSYPSHIRDRVPDIQPGSPSETRTPSSGLQSPAMFPSSHDHLPFVPSGPGAPQLSGNQSLEWVTSELLRQQAASSGSQNSGIQVTPPDSHLASRPTSRPGSRHQSGFPSRAPSPERGMRNGDGVSPAASAHSVHDTYFHSSSAASRNLHNIFHTSMKPFTSLSSPFSHSSRTPSHSHLANSTIPSHSRTHSSSDTRNSRQSTIDHTSIDHTPPQGSFTEVPDYEVASRGFAGGGVPPLSSMRGLPSYEEASSQVGTPVRSRTPEDLTRTSSHSS